MLRSVSLLLWAVSFSYQTEKVCISEHGDCNSALNCKQCRPLQWLVSNAQFISNNSMVAFLPGNHTLNGSRLDTGLVTIKNKNNLSLIALDSDTSTMVLCTGKQSGFLIKYSMNIHIRGIVFKDCGVTFTKTMSALHLFGVVNATLTKIAILNGTGYNLVLSSTCGGYIDITDSSFIAYPQESGSNTGNVIIQLDFSCSNNQLVATTVSLNNTVISLHDKKIKSEKESKEHKRKGLKLWIHQAMVNVTVYNTTVENHAERNVEINMLNFNDNSSRVYIIDSCILNGRSDTGAGVYVSLAKYESCSEYQKKNTAILSFINTTFQGNKASYSGGAVQLHTEPQGSFCKINLDKCTFTHNQAMIGGALLITQGKLPTFTAHANPQVSVYINNCTFEENCLTQYGNSKDAIVSLNEVDEVCIRNTEFIKNEGSPLLLVASTVLFEESVKFISNRAKYGAAIRVCEHSFFFLQKGTHVFFENNKAMIAGGAIYVEDQHTNLVPQCFFQPLSNSSVTELKEEMSLNFTNNTATLAGDAIYGGSVDHCSTTFFSLNSRNYRKHKHVFEAIFNFSQYLASTVTSNPRGVCICDPNTGQPNCTVRELLLGEHYPGERFIVNVTAVGQRGGTVPALIDVTDSSANVTLFPHHYRLPTTTKCQSITLAVFSQANKTVAFNMSVVETNPVKEHFDYFAESDVRINVKMADCPWIFQLDKFTNSCKCNTIFNHNLGEHLCNISSMSFTKTHSVWVECVVERNSSPEAPTCSKIKLSNYCKNTNCRHAKIYTPYNLSTRQCTEGREGRLCGICKSNYSLSLGTPQCLFTADHCSIWRTLAIIIVFLLAGIFLICILTILNFTVAEGTVNGVLYYSNAIQANHDIFFNSTFLGSCNYTLRVIFAWMNLDLGFNQLCFYSGMTAYQRIWLEYCFLLYLLLLGVLIVFLSRKYICFTRLVGRNVVPVLSTVVSISLYKLVKNSLKAFNCSSRHFWSTDNKQTNLWLEDETMTCFTAKHIPLVLLSLFLCLAAVLYTMCLLMIQCLQRRSDWSILKWVNKLRPFFDANTGPCRDQYQFWPGLLLFIRVGIITLSSINVKPRLLAVTAISMLLFILIFVFPKGVYKKWPLNVFEFCFFFCLALSFATVAYSIDKKKFHEKQASTTVAIALLILLTVILYHTYNRVSGTKRGSKMIAWIKHNFQCKPRRLDDQNVTPNETTPLVHPQLMPRMVNFITPREPLLEDD